MARPEVYEPQKLNCVGSGSKRFHVKKFLSMEIPVPSLEEQIKISDFCSNLDRLIALNKHKLSAMKEYKKSMLQRMFPKAGNSIPELRFPGFSDDWMERKLGEIIVKGASGGTPDTSKEDYYKGTIPFLNISDISNSNGHIFDTEKHITEDALQNSAAWIVPKGAISLAMYASVGKAAILNDVSTSQAFYNMIFENDSTRDVVFQILRKMEITNGWYYFISRGTQPNLNAGRVKNLSISLPTDIEEQSLIGSFFSNLDRLIALQSQKLTQMELYKKALLQRMFC